MANSLAEVTPKLLAQGLLALRQQAIMARLVNRGYEPTAGLRGSRIDVPIPSAIAARAVTAAVTYPANVDSAPTSVSIPLDQWWEAPFHMSDKDKMEVMAGFLPMQASEAIKSLANKVDTYILGLAEGLPGYVGTAGTTPFASTLGAYHEARVLLNRQLAPMDNRRVVLDPAAEGNALALTPFLHADTRGDQGGIISGQIGHKIGADWFMDQNILTHTSGSVTAATTSGTQTAGAAVLVLNVTPTAGTLLAGDVLKIGTGSSAQYFTVDAAATGTAGVMTVSITPNVGTGIATTQTVSLAGGNAVMNLMFHRDCFAFATRPLEADTEGLGNLILSAVDPVSGLTLRLEVSRQYKQTTFSYDILYGGALVRPEFGVRILG